MSSKRFFLGQKNIDGSLATAVKCLSAKKERLGVSLWSDSPSFSSSHRLAQSVPRRRSPRLKQGAIGNPFFSDDEDEDEEEKKSPVALFKPLRFSSPPKQNDEEKEEEEKKSPVALFKPLRFSSPPKQNDEEEEEEQKSPVVLFEPLRLSSSPKQNEELDKREEMETKADAHANAEADAEANSSFPVTLFQPLEEAQVSFGSSAKPCKHLWESSDEESGFEQFLSRVRPRKEDEEEKEEEEEEEEGLSDFIVPDDEVESSVCVDSGSDAEEEEEEDEDAFHSPTANSSTSDEQEEEGEKKEVRTKTRKPRRAVMADIFSSEGEETDEELRRPLGDLKIGARTPLSAKRWREAADVDPKDNPSAFLLSLTEKENARGDEVSKFVRAFKKHREELTTTLFRLFNEHVFQNKLPPELTIEWNARLTKTAGHCKHFLNRATQVRSAKIRLSTKVCSSAERVRDTLVHELCHAATWLIDHNMRAGHGPVWKAWARRVSLRFPKMPPVTTTHNYVIFTKFTYRCTGCGAHVNRHSRSVDTEKMVCSLCRSKFELVVNTPGRTPRGPNRFAEFVREHYANAKRAGGSHGEAMRELSKRFAAMKTAAEVKENSF